MTADIDETMHALKMAFDGQIQVTPDKFGGLRLRIVDDTFSNDSQAARRRRILELIDEEDIAGLALLTPGEVNTEFDPGSDVDSPKLPLWPGTLADGAIAQTSTVHLASLSQASLEPPVIATFYSLRGGVGRSTALAQTAHVLAELGLSVLCIDMDLEAPGLANLFGVADKVHENSGVVPLLTEIEILGEVPASLTDHFLRVDTPNQNKRIELLPAGKIGPAYAQDLSLLDPAAWFEEEVNPLRKLIDGVRDLDPVVRPEAILIDSRTGLSPISAPLLFETADIDIITFLPHPQSKTGTGLLTRALLTAETARGQREGAPRTPEPRFVVSPVPPSDENYARAKDRAIDWISGWLAPARNPEGGPAFRDLEEIVEVIRYSEETASSDVVSPRGTSSPYRPIAEWIAGLVESSGAAGAEDADGEEAAMKPAVLEQLTFNTQTADLQEPGVLEDIFVSTDSVNDALDLTKRLVTGRKGSGKTLLFRRLQFDSSLDSVAITSPDGSGGSILPLTSTTYEAIDRAASDRNLTWQAAWRALIGLSLQRGLQRDVPQCAATTPAPQTGSYRNAQLLQDIRSLFEIQDVDLTLEDWLAEIDESLDGPVYLLFDGLDTGFGNQLALRRNAVTGLLLLLNGQARSLKNIHFKVFLREDIFRAVELPNKSHLRAESVRLAWNDQYDYLRLVIKQAWRSEAFRDLVHSRFGGQTRPAGRRAFNFSGTEIEYWPDDIVLDVWQLLVGERMSGGKTAFTHNWVWTRLADANEDHAPRHLINLFEEAVAAERLLQPGTPNNRVIIRPKALNDALDPASEGAVDAIREEYGELEPLLERLQNDIGTTPFEDNKLLDDGSVADVVNLAREVGVIGRGIDERYRVPELYRRALKMNRKGQQ